MRWLHISDIHFGYNAATVITMRQKLLEYASKIEAVDCLFITGDLRYGRNSPDSYPEETLDFIRTLQSVLKVTPECTFIVPGNHDVNRNGKVLDALVTAEAKKYTTAVGTIEEGTLQVLNFLRQPFRELYHKICGREEPGWHYCIPFHSFNIICLNTAILCGRDGEDGSLIVGSELLNNLAATVDPAKPGIVLAHHDFGDLRQDEQQRLEIALKDMGAVLYLCGHKHVALSRIQKTYRAQQDLLVLICGTNMDSDPILAQTDMDFFVGEVDDTGRNGCVQAFKWLSRSSAWVADVEFSIPHGKTDGMVTFSSIGNTSSSKFNQNFTTPTFSFKEIYDQYRRYIRNQCGEIEQNGLPMNAEDVQRRYALRRLFVPLTFSKSSGQQLSEEEQSLHALRLNNMESLALGVDNLWSTDPIFKNTNITLNDLIPKDGPFRMFILSDPGGGKTTLLKWLASVYCFPEEYTEPERHLPNRELFPLWLRCREIPEGQCTVWGSIQNIVKRSEWFPGQDTTKNFLALVEHHLQNGTLLLLVDGLDEIGIEADRDHFVNQLRIFFDNYPKVNIVVSSRPTGFSLVTQSKFPEFDLVHISALSSDDILKLCTNWNLVVKPDPVEAKHSAAKLAKRIIENERIFKLASNPLLLTTLLLVERRVGRLPTKRADLYAEAVQVLLETWNRDPHEKHQPLNLNDSRLQLAYIAFHLMKTHEKQISQSDLVELINNARNDLSELLSDRIHPEVFIKRIEERSSLLIQKGLRRSKKSGIMEPIYEFQHLTFQEYLAACAVIENCYPGANASTDLVSVLIPYLSDTSMKEVIALAAVRLPRFTQDKLAQAAIDLINSDNISSTLYEHLRNILQQFVADEISLSADMVDRILECCYGSVLWANDQDYLRQIMEGKNAKKLYECFARMDERHHNGYEYFRISLSILSGEISDPYQYYLDNRNSSSTKECFKAIMAISDLFWIKQKDTLAALSSEQKDALKKDLFEFASADDHHINRAALSALRMSDFVQTSDDFSRYFSAFVHYINNNNDLPKIISVHSLPFSKEEEKITLDTELSVDALEKTLVQIQNYVYPWADDYDEVLTLGLLVALSSKHFPQLLSDAFAMLREYRARILVLNSKNSENLYRYDIKLAQILRGSVLRDDYPEKIKRVVQEHILKTDLAHIREVIKLHRRITYTDYSIIETEPYLFAEPMPFNETSKDQYQKHADRIISYIQFRLKEIGCPINSSDAGK